jgi:hypothetical protein
MSWSPLLPNKPAPVNKLKAGVTGSISAGSGRRPRLMLSFRPEQLDRLAWLTAGASLQVNVGFGEHAGMLRIMPNGLHILRDVKLAKPAGSVVALYLPLPSWLIPDKRRVAPLAHNFTANWIEVTLPTEWRTPAGASASVQPPKPQPAQPAGPTGNATPPARAAQLAAAAADLALRKARGLT